MMSAKFKNLVTQMAAAERAKARNRVCGTMCDGSPFSDPMIERVWKMAIPYGVVSDCEVRIDACGTYMVRDLYGHPTHKWAWEIDHILPVKRGGTDAIWNLQPLQRTNNRRKGSKFTAEWAQLLLSRLNKMR